MKDGVTVGVVTYERSELFAQMLDYLATSIRACTFPVDLVVVNNSGPVARADVLAVLDRSAIAEVCTVRLLDSAENNISIGRNLALDGCRTRLLAFLDDDEYPRPDWLSRLVACQASGVGQLVGGPILPVFPDAAPRWVKAIDLHNARGLATGDIIRRTATGNCLLDTAVLDGHRFDPAFGRSGGGDAHFFETLSRRGHTLVWCAEAIVEETISAERATARFALFRFIKQGNNFSRFMLAMRRGCVVYSLGLGPQFWHLSAS